MKLSKIDYKSMTTENLIKALDTSRECARDIRDTFGPVSDDEKELRVKCEKEVRAIRRILRARNTAVNSFGKFVLTTECPPCQAFAPKPKPVDFVGTIENYSYALKHLKTMCDLFAQLQRADAETWIQYRSAMQFIKKVGG